MTMTKGVTRISSSTMTLEVCLASTDVEMTNDSSLLTNHYHYDGMTMLMMIMMVHIRLLHIGFID